MDRVDAAQRLAKALAPYRGQHPLVLAIPRGSVPTGKIIAAALAPNEPHRSRFMSGVNPGACTIFVEQGKIMEFG
ncbi:MAG: hypothetical protein HY848_09640 [Betaproteobacteria bacterium]|nr:hypothetical protein [Betaproteobacteria bacterium]